MTLGPVRVLALITTLCLAGACSTAPGGAPATAPSSSAAVPSDTTPSEAAPPSAAGGEGSVGCPTSQPDPLPAGETRTVTIETEQGTIAMGLEADLSPIAAGNFVALAACGYYDGVVFHRLVPGFVIQGGDPTGTGTGGPGYTIEDEPVTTDYHRGTVAMARTPQPDSVGSQFFIVLDDAAQGALAQANTYQIIGEVTAGMDVVDAIAAMPNSGPDTGNQAIDPVAMTKVTVSNP
jgi:cyclophilin family peptidyl-prolyl cis-trans isomerase